MTPTTEPGRLDKPSKKLAALHFDLDELEEAIRKIRAQAVDLERAGFSRAVTGDRVAVTRSGHEQGMQPVRLEGEEADQGELWASEGWPLARRCFGELCRSVEHARVDVVRVTNLMMNFLNAGLRPEPRHATEVIERAEHQAALEAQRRRTQRGEDVDARMPGQVQPKWHGR